MVSYLITYRQTIVQEWIELKKFSSLAEAYQHAVDTVAKQDAEPGVHDEEGWLTNEDLTSRVECAEIMDPGDVTHVFSEIPADLAVKPADAIDTLEVADDNTWEGAVDRIEELGQNDKDLFGPVL